MATPIFNSEIVKLRRRLGDVYNDDDSLITTVNVGDSPDIGGAYKRDELEDIYNDAVRSFIDYVTTMLEPDLWHEFLPGYVTTKIIPSASSPLSLSSIDPRPFKIQSVIIPSLSAKNVREYVFTPPGKYYSYVRSFHDKGERFYTVADDALILSEDGLTIWLAYVKEHTNVLHGEDDLPQISGAGLKRILLYAEREARAHKNPDMSDLPEAKLRMQQESDLIKSGLIRREQ